MTAADLARSSAPQETAPPAFIIDHAGSSVGDLEASIRFYTDAFGFSVEETFRIPNTPVEGAVLISRDGARIELFHREGSTAAPTGDPIESTAQRGWFQLALRVTDVRAAFAYVTKAGGTPVREPFRAPDGRSWVAFVGDPDGHLIELIERENTTRDDLA